MHECAPGLLMCRNGECVSAHYRCNESVDCLDGSDERACEEMRELDRKNAMSRTSQPSSPFHTTSSSRSTSRQQKPCDNSGYRCSSGACIESADKCNGVRDCVDGDDEAECDAVASSNGAGRASLVRSGTCVDAHHIKCASGDRCILREWKCDGERDCDDGSDEENCDAKDEVVGRITIELDRKKAENSTEALPTLLELLSMEEETLCDADHFQCDGGKCVDASLTCDGKPDCLLGDDEGVRCAECGSRVHNPCSHMCTNTPRGPRCSCPQGMRIDEIDGSTCLEVDDCELIRDQCSQRCSNSREGAKCTCEAGYELASDGRTCHLSAQRPDGHVYVSLAGEVRSAPMFTPQLSAFAYETIVATDHIGTMRNLDVDVRSGRLFASLELMPQVGALVVVENGVTCKLRENITGLSNVAVDWIGRNVLFTVRHPSPAPGVYLCKMNGLFCKRVVQPRTSEGIKQRYRGLAVNARLGLMAWIDESEVNRRIMAANLDGSGAAVIVDRKLGYPTGITFDVIKNEVYFADSDTNMIEKVNMDTGRRTTVIYPVNHPYDLAYFANLLFWTEWGTETLKVAAVGGQHSTPILLHSFVQFPYGIALNHTLLQTAMSGNPCENVDCPWMCVVVQSANNEKAEGMEARCVCPEEYEENKEYDANVEGSLPCVLKEKSVLEELPKLSHVSLEVMAKYCDEGSACINGGTCVKHVNDFEQLTSITCECANGYGGLFCELKSASESRVSDGEQDEEVGIGWILVLVLLLFMLACVVVWGRRHSDDLGDLTRTTIHRVKEARLPARASEAIQNTKRNLSMGRGAGPAFSSTGENGEPTATLPPTSLSSGNERISPPSSVLSDSACEGSFANPVYDVVAPSHSTAYPYSGFREMRESDTFVVRHGVETHGAPHPLADLP